MSQKIARTCITVWGAAVISAYAIPASTPLWVRIIIAAIAAAPVVAALAVWPVLLVRGLPEVTAPAETPSDGQETRIQALPALNSGRDGDVR